ncbi:response regulator [Desulfobacterales bacterium HSG16]|nr:response regulator [Desulfobacterales bacterium HSG16]
MKTVLVVEDNRDNMDLIEEILEDEGYAILQAFRAEDGLTILKKNKIDMIVMDISLPQMSGLEATRHIKADVETRDIPILVLTAHARETDRIAALSAGCDDFLTKPIDEDVLMTTIRKFID